MRHSGFTLVELVVAMTLSLIVLAISLPFFQVQAKAVERGVGRSEATQSARVVQNAIDRELRLAGGEVGQPVIVQATPFALTFNVDLVSNVAGDPSAVYVNTDVDSLSVGLWDVSHAAPLPLTGAVYPTRNYYDATGHPSGAETISYYLLPDATAGRADLYVLWRRVNGGDSTMVARDLQIPADTAWFFRYSRVNASGALVSLPTSSLPLHWTDSTHAVDSIRVVETRVSALYRDDRAQRDVVQTVYGATRLLNAGLLKERACGMTPLPPRTVVDSVVTALGGQAVAVRVSWEASVEEASGERDVGLYVVQRRPAGGSEWMTLHNVPANGSGTYAYDDFDIASGAWIYGVFAQDCSPTNSPTVAAGNVVIP